MIPLFRKAIVILVVGRNLGQEFPPELRNSLPLSGCKVRIRNGMQCIPDHPITAAQDGARFYPARLYIYDLHRADIFP